MTNTVRIHRFSPIFDEAAPTAVRITQVMLSKGLVDSIAPFAVEVYGATNAAKVYEAAEKFGIVTADEDYDAELMRDYGVNENSSYADCYEALWDK